MVRKQPQTLFEVYSSFRGVPHRQGEAQAEQPRQPSSDGPKPAATPVVRAAGDGYVVRLTAGQVFAAVLLVLMALAVAGYAGYTIGYGKMRTYDDGPPLDEVAVGPAHPEVLEQSGPNTIDEQGDVRGDEDGTGDNGDTGNPTLPVVGEGGGTIDPELRGDYRVRIMSLPIEHRDTPESLKQSRSFLAEKDIATDIEQRGRNYYLYSKQTFPTESHEKAIELRDRIRLLGGEYARRVNRTNEFSSAYIVKKP